MPGVVNNFARVLVLLQVLVTLNADAQEANAEHQAAEKIRQIIHQAKRAKTDKEHWLVAYEALLLFQKPVPDAAQTAAAKELLKEFLFLGEQTSDNQPHPEFEAIYKLITIVTQVAGDRFTGALLPLIESADDDKLRKSALEFVLEFLPDKSFGPHPSRPAGLETWLASYLRQGKLPPKEFLDRLFEEKPVRAVQLFFEVYSSWLNEEVPPGHWVLFAYVSSEVRNLELLQTWVESEAQLRKYLPEDRCLALQKDVDVLTKRVAQDLQRLWDSCPQWYVRRYVVEQVRKYPKLFMTPELLKLMEKENHPAIKPLVEKLLKPSGDLAPKTP